MFRAATLLRLCLLSPVLLLAACGSSSNTGPGITPVSLGQTNLAAAEVSSPYAATFFALNGTEPYTFSISAGALPAGLSLAANGTLSGTPTTAGTASFTVQVADSGHPQTTASQAFTLAVSAAPVLQSATLPGGLVGTAYSTTLNVVGGTAPYGFRVSAGTLPAGLTLSTTGTISGTPTLSVASSFTVAVADSFGVQSTASYQIEIAPSSNVVITTTTLPAAQVANNYSAALAIRGGTAPYTASISAGGLPAGIALSSSGSFSGQATTAGAYVFTVTVTDSSAPQQTTSASFTLNVGNSLVQVNTATTLATVPAMGYGIHTSVYDAQLTDTANLPGLLATAGVTTLRYPGGIYSDVYHWAQRSITPFYASASNACGAAQNGYLAAGADFGGFLKTLQAVNGQAVLTINYGTSVSNSTASKSAGTYYDDCSEPNTFGQPQEAAAWVAYANGSPSSTTSLGTDSAGFNWHTVGYWASLRAATPLGTDDGYNFLRIGQPAPLNIHYWELGNEIFYNGYEGNQNSETDDHAPYIYPSGYSSPFDSRAEVTDLSPAAYGNNAIAYINAMRAVDPNIKIGLVLSSPNVDPIPGAWNPAAIQAVCAGATFDFGIFHYYPGTFQAATAAQLLGDPQQDMPALVAGAKQQIEQYCSNYSSVQFLVTETNENFGLATGTPSQVQGLFATNEFLAALQNGFTSVEWLELHNNSGFLDGSENPMTAYYGIEMAHLLAAPGDALVSSSATTPASGYPVVSYASLKANGSTGVLLINPDPVNATTVAVTVTGTSLGTSATQYSYGVTTAQSAPALVGTPTALSGNTFLVTVPAYTATEMVVAAP